MRATPTRLGLRGVRAPSDEENNLESCLYALLCVHRTSHEIGSSGVRVAFTVERLVDGRHGQQSLAARSYVSVQSRVSCR